MNRSSCSCGGQLTYNIGIPASVVVVAVADVAVATIETDLGDLAHGYGDEWSCDGCADAHPVDLLFWKTVLDAPHGPVGTTTVVAL